MEQNLSSQPSSTPVNTQDTTSVSTTKPSSNMKFLLLGVGLTMAFLAVGIGAYAFGVQKNAKSTSTITPTPTNSENLAMPTNSMLLVTSVPANLTLYKDSNLENFSFNYDPAIWSITTVPTEKSGLLTLKNQTNGDQLTFKYDLGWGMGGALNTFKEEELVSLDNSKHLYRLKNTHNGVVTYTYGKDDLTSTNRPIIFFNENLEKKNEALTHCEEIANGTEGMTFFTVEECEDIKKGTITGYVGEPTFTRSLMFKAAVPLSKINPEWANDEYVKSSGLDTGALIIDTQFQGVNVEEADKILQQLTPLQL